MTVAFVIMEVPVIVMEVAFVIMEVLVIVMEVAVVVMVTVAVMEVAFVVVKVSVVLMLSTRARAPRRVIASGRLTEKSAWLPRIFVRLST